MRCFLEIKFAGIWLTHRTRHICILLGVKGLTFDETSSYLGAKPEGDEHEKEEDGPEGWHRQAGDGLRVDDECQTSPCKTQTLVTQILPYIHVLGSTQYTFSSNTIYYLKGVCQLLCPKLPEQ